VRVTIAGAGIVGCGIAYELARRGAHVRVLDRRSPGGGATRASAGILAPYIEGHDPALRHLGSRSLAVYPEFLQRVQRDGDLDVEYEQSGTLQVALSADEASRLEQAARTLGEAGVEHRLLDAPDVRRAEPALPPGVVNALEIPAHGYVAAGELTRALATAAMRHGATFDVGTAISVEGAPAGGTLARLHTADAVIECDAVIVAAGSWSTSLDAAARAPHDAVKPIRGQLLQLRLPERPARSVIWGDDCYLVCRRDGAVLAGATVEDVGFDERATSDGVQRLLSAAVTLMPRLRDAAFEEVRVGLRPMTRDELPAVGASSTMPHVFYATGHYRNGVLLAPLTAALVADLVLDGRIDADLASMSPARFGL
jgi:glycine oxidase